MRSKKNLSSEELDEQIKVLLGRRTLMDNRRIELELAIEALNRRLRGLYAKRTIALNLTLPLEDVTK
jgi:hypothetical protein